MSHVLALAILLAQQAAGPPVLSVSAARADTDGDARPDLLGRTVTVAGRATTASGALHDTHLRVFIQDDSAGIMLFAYQAGAPIAPGDSVVATGVLEQYAGLAQLEVDRYTVVRGPRRIPRALSIPPRAVDLERHEGRLVHVRGVVRSTGLNRGGRYVVLGSPENDPAPPIQIFVGNQHSAADMLDDLRVGDEVVAVGPLGQYDFEPPYTGYYQVYPRSPADIRPIGLTRAHTRRFATAGAVALILTLLWVLTLRAQVRRRTRQLREAEGRLGLLVNQLPAILWATDTDLRVTTSDGAALRHLGVEPGDGVGRSLAEYFGPGEADNPALTYHRRALAGEPVSYQIEWAGRWYDVHIQPLRDTGGRITGVAGVAMDITDRRAAEEELRVQRAHFAQLFESAPEAIVVLDENDRVLQVNPEFTRMFGYEPAEALGRTINELIAPPDRRDEAITLTRRVADGSKVNVETVRCRKDGTPIHVSILGTPIEGGGAGRVYGIYREITERKQLEEQLRQAQKMEAVGRLAGGIAHDFNNLLTAIGGYASTLLENVTTAEWRQDLEEIRKAAGRAAGLTRQLLAFSRKQIVQPRTVDLNHLVRDMEGLLRRLLGEDVALETSLEPGLAYVHADPGQLDQMLMNLAVNARDAMPGGGTLRIRTSNTVLEPSHPRARAGARPGPHVCIAVSDTGAGIPPEALPHIFDPFFTTKEQGHGTGLGLATVYGIVEQNGGHIRVDSEPGRGTTFEIYLPRADAPAEHHPEVPRADLPGAGETILLAEDDDAVRRLAIRILQRRGYRVLEARNGVEALRAAEENPGPIHLLLTDVVMPEMGGRELAERIAERSPATRILFMSGYTEDHVLRRGITEEGAAFIQKPFSPADLARTVRAVLDAAEPDQVPAGR